MLIHMERQMLIPFNTQQPVKKWKEEFFPKACDWWVTKSMNPKTMNARKQ
jgi:hypothetical protein